MDRDKLHALLEGNIRADETGDEEELRQSLIAYGWIAEFPALLDERGVVLVGHRRLRLAKEIGIAPVTKVLQLGDGDAADAERLKLALASNIGFKVMTARDRKRIAEHLYGTRKWSMQRIAEAVGVSKKTVSLDLKVIVTEGNNSPHPKTSSNPRGAGRPKGIKTRPSKVSTSQRDRIAKKVLDEGKTWREVIAEEGVSATVVRGAVNFEEGRRYGEANPSIDPATLSTSAQEKLARATRQMERQLQNEFEGAVAQRMAEALGDVILSRYGELKSLYNGVINRRRHGVMKPAEYRLVLSCLHPDSRNASAGRLAEAMAVIQKYKLSLVDESTEPTPIIDFPKTREEWLERKRRTTEARRAKRAGGEMTRRQGGDRD